MISEGKLTQGSAGELFVNCDDFWPDNQRSDAWFVDGAVMMPGAGSALLIVEGAIVMMNRGKNGAHADVEQAQNCCNGSLHSDDDRNVSRRNCCAQAELNERRMT